MENTDHVFDPSEENASSSDASLSEFQDLSFGITDQRVVQLLIVLDEIDLWIREQRFVSDTQVDELVAAAILASGFSDPTEVPNWAAVWPARNGYC